MRFARKKVVNVDFVMLTEYAADIKTAVAYPPASLVNTFGEWMAKNDKTQLRISETEKYAHVTFFFNGGVEESFKGEDRILINSPKVATYDLQPEMSSAELTEKLVAAIKSGKYDTIICNYPNGDMVGHTGVMEAAVKAVEALDHCVEEVAKAVESVGGQLLITADHGNAEQMRDPATGQAHTAHTNLPVPLIYVGDKNVKAVEGGKLSDIAPTHRIGTYNAGSIGTGAEKPQWMSGFNNQCLFLGKFFQILLNQSILHPILANLPGFTISNKFVGI